ncbi:MAG: diacylglycerol kinase family lipid kinase [Prevotellaceae bacterium]|jgi:YegS/Rv2252/BmrU family lipid kinase|nr:diacylglycerol kinase family lipid kinase [Prevotellaceae bacterium]
MVEPNKSSRWMVIVNPKAGRGHGLRDWPAISNRLNFSGVDFTCVFTEKKFHAVELTVKAMNDGFRKIIVVGGDGTVNEVVNGLFIQKKVATSEVTLSVIPVGTGNDWVRMLGIPRTYSDAVNSICAERTILQDVGKITFEESRVPQTRYMANVAGIGFDAIVNRRYNRLKEAGRTGKWTYIMSTMFTLFKYRTKRFTATVDGRLFFDGCLFSGTVGVGKYNGGGMLQMPAAALDDGLMDITLIRKMSLYKFFINFNRLYNGTIYNFRKVKAAQGKSIKIASYPPSPIEIDGEACGYSPFTFELVPKSIKVVIGEKFNLIES